MSHQGSAILVPLRVRNPFAGKAYPRDGILEAVLDTGYSGFLFVPQDVFAQLGLPRSAKSVGVLADGRSLRVEGAYASLEFPGQRVTVDGLVQTSEGAAEVLLGLDGMRRLFVGIDSCARRVSLRAC